MTVIFPGNGKGGSVVKRLQRFEHRFSSFKEGGGHLQGPDPRVMPRTVGELGPEST